MYRDHRIDRRQADEATPAPTRCPGCGSAGLTTTSKVITSATYWRCKACGEIWNAGRRKTAGRYVR
jgi:uncharacterized Zn finger protein